MNAMTPELRSTLAAAYVLGTLRGPARKAFKQRMARDPKLRAAVYRWEQHFSVLNRGFKPVLPSEGQWKRIEAAAAAARSAPPPVVAAAPSAATPPGAPASPPPLVAVRSSGTRPGKAPVNKATSPAKSPRQRAAPAIGPATATPPPTAPVVTTPPVASAPPRRATPSASPPAAVKPVIASGHRRRAARAPRAPWSITKLWAVAATVLAVMLGGVLSVVMMDSKGPAIAEPQGLLMAVLATDDGRWVVQATADGEQILVQVEGAPKLPNDRSAELWWIGEDGTPVSVGVLPNTGRQVLTRSGLTGDEPVPTFAVSIEPRGGSPTGAPTGKVITTFKAVRSL